MRKSYCRNCASGEEWSVNAEMAWGNLLYRWHFLVRRGSIKLSVEIITILRSFGSLFSQGNGCFIKLTVDVLPIRLNSKYC